MKEMLEREHWQVDADEKINDADDEVKDLDTGIRDIQVKRQSVEKTVSEWRQDEKAREKRIDKMRHWVVELKAGNLKP